MPYLALIDQLNKFIRRKSSFLVLAGYSFNDSHLNDAIVNALQANPTGMVLAMQFGNYQFGDDEIQNGERYPNAYRLAKRQHNLNVWTFDKAIIGTNLCDWRIIRNPEENERDISDFVHNVKLDEQAGATTPSVKLGDFSELTSFLKMLIGSDQGEINAN